MKISPLLLQKHRWPIALLISIIIVGFFFLLQKDQRIAAPIPSPTSQQIGQFSAIQLEFDQQTDPDWVDSNITLESDVEGTIRWEGSTMWYTLQEPLCEDCAISMSIDDRNQHQIETFSYRFSLRPQEIVFLSLENLQLYRTDADSENPLQLTTDVSGIREFIASYDGEKIFFTIETQEGFQIHSMTRDGMSENLLYNCGTNRCENLSVSSTQPLITFAETTIQPAKSIVQLLNYETGDTTSIYTQNGILRTTLLWSPDDTVIVLFDETIDETILIHLNTMTQTAYHREEIQLGSWSPDGKRVYVMHTHPDITNTYSHICALDLELETYGPFQDTEDLDIGQFSPPIHQHNGPLLAYASQSVARENGKQIWLMNPDDNGKTQITDDKEFTHAHYLWDRTDEQLLYQRLNITNSNATPEIWVWHLNTNQFELITQAAALPIWLP